jgi:hypothetical protein
MSVLTVTSHHGQAHCSEVEFHLCIRGMMPRTGSRCRTMFQALKVSNLPSGLRQRPHSSLYFRRAMLFAFLYQGIGMPRWFTRDTLFTLFLSITAASGEVSPLRRLWTERAIVVDCRTRLSTLLPLGTPNFR